MQVSSAMLMGYSFPSLKFKGRDGASEEVNDLAGFPQLNVAFIPVIKQQVEDAIADGGQTTSISIGIPEGHNASGQSVSGQQWFLGLTPEIVAKEERLNTTQSEFFATFEQMLRLLEKQTSKAD